MNILLLFLLSILVLPVALFLAAIMEFSKVVKIIEKNELQSREQTQVLAKMLTDSYKFSHDDWEQLNRLTTEQYYLFTDYVHNSSLARAEGFQRQIKSILRTYRDVMKVSHQKAYVG